MTTKELNEHYNNEKIKIKNKHIEYIEQHKLELEEELELINQKKFELKKLKKQYTLYLKTRLQEDNDKFDIDTTDEEIDQIEKHERLKKHLEKIEMKATITKQKATIYQEKLNTIIEELLTMIINVPDEKMQLNIPNYIYKSVNEISTMVIFHNNFDLSKRTEVETVVKTIIQENIRNNVQIMEGDEREYVKKCSEETIKSSQEITNQIKKQKNTTS